LFGVRWFRHCNIILGYRSLFVWRNTTLVHGTSNTSKYIGPSRRRQRIVCHCAPSQAGGYGSFHRRRFVSFAFIIRFFVASFSRYRTSSLGSGYGLGATRGTCRHIMKLSRRSEPIGAFRRREKRSPFVRIMAHSKIHAAGFVSLSLSLFFFFLCHFTNLQEYM